MKYHQLRVASVQVGDVDAGRATLTLQRDDPLPGVPSLKSWRINVEIRGATPLLEDAEVALTMANGRQFAGHAFLTSHRVVVNSLGTSVAYETQGTGPLAGTTEADYD